METQTINLVSLKPLKFVFISVLIAVGVWVAESIFNLLLGRALEEMSFAQRFIVACLFFVSLSVFISGNIYKNRKTWLMLTVSVIVLVLVRFILSSIYFDISTAGYIVIYTLGQTLIMFLVVLGFVPIFRMADKRFKFAKLKDIRCNINDSDSKTKYDTGVCCNCENVTKIAKENPLLDFLPKIQFHFCDNCGIFLRSNPLVSLSFGLAEIILSFCLIVGMALSLETQEQSTMHNVGFLLLLCGVIAGLRSGYSGARGIVLSPKENETKSGTFF